MRKKLLAAALFSAIMLATAQATASSNFFADVVVVKKNCNKKGYNKRF